MSANLSSPCRHPVLLALSQRQSWEYGTIQTPRSWKDRGERRRGKRLMWKLHKTSYTQNTTITTLQKLQQRSIHVTCKDCQRRRPRRRFQLWTHYSPFGRIRRLSLPRGFVLDFSVGCQPTSSRADGCASRWDPSSCSMPVWEAWKGFLIFFCGGWQEERRQYRGARRLGGEALAGRLGEKAGKKTRTKRRRVENSLWPCPLPCVQRWMRQRLEQAARAGR